jgi:hypothetical protein
MPDRKHDHAVPPHDRPRPRPASESAAAGESLGRDHPLARALESFQVGIERAVVLAVVGAFAAGLLSRGDPFGLPLLIAAVIVQAATVARLVLTRERVRLECRELIIERCAPAALASVERERERLADPRKREELARSIEHLADRAAATTAMAPNMPLRFAREVEPELRELASLLRAETTDVVGVALIERLVTFAGSALYGGDERKLRDELAQIRYRLRAAH